MELRHLISTFLQQEDRRLRPVRNCEISEINSTI